MAIQNAKSVNMPKENVERAIKKAVSKDTADYKEVIYEGYAPHGIAILVETAAQLPTYAAYSTNTAVLWETPVP